MKDSGNEILQISLTITLCMLVGRLLNLESSVYLALFPTILMTKAKDHSWLGLYNTFKPAFFAAVVALIVTESFQEHPFIIWTISLFFIDMMRRKADNPAKLGQMIMPLFNWILIVVFAQSSDMDMPDRIREIFISMVITALIARAMVTLFPKWRDKPKIIATKLSFPVAQQVSYQHRFVSVALIGTGLAILMNIDLISATFCMVPVIAAATQFSRKMYAEVVNRRFMTQIGGCALAVIFSVLMAGHQGVLLYYAAVLGALVFAITKLMVTSNISSRDIHADALLATVLPIQLYLDSSQIGLESTFSRAWELTVTLGILYAAFRLTQYRVFSNQDD